MSEFDLFSGLNSLSSGDKQWYDKLDAAGKKAASPFVIGRWLTGTKDQEQLLRLNAFFNPYVFSLGNEKALLFKLLAVSATGRTRRYNWIKPPGGASTPKFAVEVISKYYDTTLREAELYLINHDAGDIMEMAESLGLDKDEFARLKKELGDGSGTTEKSSSRKKASR